MASPFDKALTTLSSTAHSIFDTPIHRHSLPIATATAFSVFAFSYFFQSHPRASGNKSLPLIKNAPRTSKDKVYPDDIFEGGELVDTPYGKVKTYLVGPKDGKKLLLVHGISTPAPVWKSIIPQLVQAGYRVLIFDLYGRGLSDAPILPYDIPLYVSQISFLLTSKPDWEKFSIGGMSLGGSIVSNFVHYFPQRIDKIFLICPAGGTPSSKLGATTKIFTTLPISFMQRLISISPVNPVKDANSIGSWQAKNHPGFFQSFLSTIAYGMIFDQAEVMKGVCEKFGGKIECVWGDADDVVPMESKEYFAGNMKVHVIPGGGHWIVATHGEKVAELLIAHLDS